MKTSSETLLLDVNVLIALARPRHQFHAAATKRLGIPEQRCPLAPSPSWDSSAFPPVQPPSRLLAEMVRDSLHIYLDRLPPRRHHARFLTFVPGSGSSKTLKSFPSLVLSP
jgi:hypothetical protein